MATQWLPLIDVCIYSVVLLGRYYLMTFIGKYWLPGLNNFLCPSMVNIFLLFLILISFTTYSLDCGFCWWNIFLVLQFIVIILVLVLI